MIATSIFAGLGGSSLGYREAGFEIRHAVERDRLAAETYELNHPIKVDRRDVREVRGGEILDAAGGAVDLLDASPPCEAHSLLGRRDPADVRGAPMLEEWARLVLEVRPRALVLENVLGVEKGASGRALGRAVAELEGGGYRVALRRIEASRLGVPQLRPRIFAVGFRRDTGVDPAAGFPRPDPRHAAVADVLPGVARVVVLDRPGARPPWHEGGSWLASGPAPTVTASGLWRAAREFARLEDGEGRLRRPTAEEVAQLCGFPPTFAFPERAGHGARWEMLGRAVPPPVARRVGEAVARALGGGSTPT